MGRSSPRRIAVFGAGYIGLVTGACFAELGHHVVIRDVRPEKVERLRAGDIPIYEPGLGELITENSGRLSFTLDAAGAVREAEVVYVCVDTPPTVSGDADLSRVWSVIDALKGTADLSAVITKSTVPVGTGAKIRSVLDEAGMQHVGYAANPEFTAEGRAVGDFLSPDRIVVGTSEPETLRLVEELHAGVDAPVVAMDIASAEMVKLASNAFLATRISFINEIANVCDRVGADVERVAEGVGLDHRVGRHFLRAGIGYGGSCFPKDSLALRAVASNTGYDFQLLGAAINVNELQKRRVVQRLKDVLGTLKDKRIALLGLAFKPGTDDMREAPSTVLASRLLAEGAEVCCWDPLVKLEDVEPWRSTFRYGDPMATMTGADAAVVVTEWPQLLQISWTEVPSLMRHPVIFDGRNQLDPQKMAAHGFVYMAVGRGLPARSLSPRHDRGGE